MTEAIATESIVEEIKYLLLHFFLFVYVEMLHAQNLLLFFKKWLLNTDIAYDLYYSLSCISLNMGEGLKLTTKPLSFVLLLTSKSSSLTLEIIYIKWYLI